MKLLHLTIVFLFIYSICNAQWQKSTLDIEHASGVIYFNDKIIVGTSGSGIYYSNDDGMTWLQYKTLNNNISVIKFYEFADLFACTNSGLFRLAKGEDTWEFLDQGLFRAFYKGDDYMLAVPKEGAKLLRSTDDGDSWTVIDNDWKYAFMSIAKYNNSIIGAHDRGLYQSFDKGLSWTKIDNYTLTSELEVSNNKIYRATNSGILISENNINDWINIGPIAIFITDLTVHDDLLLISGYNNGLVCKNNTSNGWLRSDLGLVGEGIYEVKATTVIENKVYTTNNSGLWIRELNDFYIPELEVQELVVFNDNPDIGDSVNTHFSLSNNGLDTLFITDIISDNPSFRVWGKKLALAPKSGWSNVITFKPSQPGKDIATLKIIAKNNKYNNSIKVYAEALPTYFKLNQNYPNPFNPTTTIQYSIPSISNVGTKSSFSQQSGPLIQLKIYDILGKEVATLINKEQTPGNYEVNFNAGNLSSGTYFYRLTTGKLSDTKKFLLLK